MPMLRRRSRRARLEAQGYDLDVAGLFDDPPGNEPSRDDPHGDEPPRDDPPEDAWSVWDRLGTRFLAGRPETWEEIVPHLPTIEAALALPYDRRSETLFERRLNAVHAAVASHSALLHGASAALRPLAIDLPLRTPETPFGSDEDQEEGFRRLGLAVGVAEQLAVSRSLRGARYANGAYRALFQTLAFLVGWRLDPETNARVREIVRGVRFVPLREIALGELRFALARIDRMHEHGADADPEIDFFRAFDDPGLDRLAREIADPRVADRAKSLLAARYARYLLASDVPTTSRKDVEAEEIATLERWLLTLVPTRIAKFAPDRLRRRLVPLLRPEWAGVPGEHRRLVALRRMVVLATLVADLGPAATPEDARAVRDALGSEGWDPAREAPLAIERSPDDGTWTFEVDDGLDAFSLWLSPAR